jgi:hypothetical protein
MAPLVLCLILLSSPLPKVRQTKRREGFPSLHLPSRAPRASAWLWLGCLAFQAHKEHIMLLSCRRTRLHCIDVNDDGSDQIRSDHACMHDSEEGRISLSSEQELFDHQSLFSSLMTNNNATSCCLLKLMNLTPRSIWRINKPCH